MAWPAFAAGIGVASLVTNFLGSRKAAKAAEEQSEEEARIEGLITDEKLRQLKLDERDMYGETLAQYSGSGVIGLMNGAPTTGSPKTLIDEQAKTFADQRKITKEVGASNVAQSLMGGEALADRYKYSGYANVGSSISSIISNYQLSTPTPGP
ncbi:unnamed protein product [marine sediment metagenome]|uniref:Uncharacterized protein n=1 Tax=marine sediment metagenome TaxID=412755 RepID=X1BBY7_9ZZZZ